MPGGLHLRVFRGKVCIVLFADRGTGTVYYLHIVQILIHIIAVIMLVGIAAVCSGLNVAFMSLNISDLKRKRKLGSTYARQLLPLRQNAHLTLSAILLTNVAAASTTPLVIDSGLNGWLAATISTLLLVVFAEIMPQALFARNAITICGRFVPLIRFMIIITYPIAWPLQVMLDRVFGTPHTELHTRHELGLLISEHLGTKESELDEDEVEIIRGALQLSEKKVSSIMTPIEDVYWLMPASRIDETHIEQIKASGHSRVPILNKSGTICFGVLLIKNLIDLDITADPPRVDDLPLHPTQMVGAGTALDTMFRKFIGAHSHLMPVEKDDKIIGIVTIEDLLEEIIGHEIEDETDHLLTRIKRTKRKKTKQ